MTLACICGGWLEVTLVVCGLGFVFRLLQKIHHKKKDRSCCKHDKEE